MGCGSGIRENPHWITDLEVKKAPDLGSKSVTLHVQMLAMVEYCGGWTGYRSMALTTRMFEYLGGLQNQND
jgi:hypothetical protein